MTDSSKNSDGNGNGSNNGNKRPATFGGASGHSTTKIVKFNGHASRNPHEAAKSPNKLKASCSDELLAQRQALPIYPTRQRYSRFFIVYQFYSSSIYSLTGL